VKTIERIKGNIFLLTLSVVIGVTVLGALFVLWLCVMAIPALPFFVFEASWRCLLVGLVGGALTLAYLGQELLGVYYISAGKGLDLSEAEWERVERAVNLLPRRLLLITLWLWPLVAFLVGAWLVLSGLLATADALRIVFCTALYSPMQGLILFYAIRQVMRRLVEEIGGPDRLPGKLARGGFSLQAKLIMTLVSLAVLPLLAGVFLQVVQAERTEIREKVGSACEAIDRVHAAGPGNPADVSGWERAVEEGFAVKGLPSRIRFQVADTASGRFLTGADIPREQRLAWRRGTLEGMGQGGCEWSIVPGTRSYLVMRRFEDPGVWISAAVEPGAGAGAMVSVWSIGVLVLMAGGVSVILGLLAARDMDASIKEISGASSSALKGDYARVRSYLPGDEMEDLAAGFNALVAGIEEQLRRSESLIHRVEESVNFLSSCTASIKDLAGKLGGVVDEQSALSSQAAAEAEQVAKTASSIRDRAHKTRKQMDEVSQACGAADGILDEVKGVIDGIVASARHINQSLEPLEMNYHRMEEVVGIIDDIADRSEILSLNAALEAGSGGEGGRRFTAVAQEVGKLSERIGEQTGRITKLFAEIRKSSLEMAQTVEIGTKRAAEAPEWMEKLSQALAGIERRAGASGGSMKEVEAMTESQSKAVEQMKFMVREINSVSRVLAEASTGMDAAVVELKDISARLAGLMEEKKKTEKNPD